MPQLHTDDDGTNALSKRVIGCAYQVLDTLGVGILQQVYKTVLVHVLRKAALEVEQQHKIAVRCDNVIVGGVSRRGIG